jgi:diaminopimelate epimerase
VIRVPFVKMHGAANDFVVVDHRTPFLPEPPDELFRRLCDRRRGVGADGVLLLERDPELDFAMRYHNADGGVAEFCGNGARCLARFALERGLGRDGVVRFRSGAGVQAARRTPVGAIELHFGRVAAPGVPETLEAAGRAFTGRAIRVGVPHFVVELADVGSVPVAEWGAALRWHAHFEPAGANIDFVERVPAPDGAGSARVAMRTFERGVEAETLACGSGAMASALWAAQEGGRSPIEVLTAGGDVLVVSFEPIEGGCDVRLTGPAEVAFAGTWEQPERPQPA